MCVGIHKSVCVRVIVALRLGHDYGAVGSKFLALGMPLSDIVAASTVNAAKALRRPELGTLKVGAVGDASVLSIREGAFPLVDAIGETVTASERIFAEGMVVGGNWWHPRAD